MLGGLSNDRYSIAHVWVQRMPEDNDILGKAKTGVEVLGKIIEGAGDDPRAKQAAANLGDAAVTVTTAINNVLLPLAGLNFAIAKARTYFGNKFHIDLQEKTKAIPADCVVEPKASLAGPALQGLAFSHEEEDLRALYLGLLATAMDGRVAENAHPAFVEVIKQIDGREARILQQFLRHSDPQPIVEVRLGTNNLPGYAVLRTHLINLLEADGKTPAVRTHVPSLIDNWVRLGLVSVTYAEELADHAVYAWAPNRPEFLELRSLHQSPRVVTLANGSLRRTDFGFRFAAAVGII